MLFNATFNNISVISWQSVLMTERTRVPWENLIIKEILVNLTFINRTLVYSEHKVGHNVDIFSLIPQWYRQYQWTDSHTENYQSVWHQAHYVVTGKTITSALKFSLTVILATMSISTFYSSLFYMYYFLNLLHYNICKCSSFYPFN